MSSRIYLEIDGVINALRGPDSWGLDTFDSTDFGGYTFVWSTSAVAKLLTLCQEFDVELIWLTGWSQDIPVLSRVLGFGQFGADARVLEEVGVGATPFQKADALLQDLQDNPVGGTENNSGNWIWLDPGTVEVEESIVYLRRMYGEGGGGIIPPVFEEIGITPALIGFLTDRLSKMVG
jgi:hypothetical protein